MCLLRLDALELGLKQIIGQVVTYIRTTSDFELSQVLATYNTLSGTTDVSIVYLTVCAALATYVRLHKAALFN